MKRQDYQQELMIDHPEHVIRNIRKVMTEQEVAFRSRSAI